MITFDHLTILGTALYVSVDNVDDAHARLVQRGVPFAHPPRKTSWGYGAELVDPDGYLVRLWDETTMRTK
jgi:predicted enzyme related to lactoylglutathione lyase